MRFTRHICLILAALLLFGCSDKAVRCDVLVVGGGTSGTVAAIQSARAEAETILIEAQGILGGTPVVGGVSFPGLFHAWGRQVIGGIGWELVSEAVALDGGTMPDFSIPFGIEHYRHQIHINPYVYSLLAEEKCLQAGVDIHYYSFPISVRRTPGGWDVDIVGKGSKLRIRCKQIVDCTGSASVVAMTGLSRLREEETQPGSLIFNFKGYDPDALDYDLIDSAIAKARKDGTLEPTDCYVAASILLSEHPGLAVSHVLGADSSTAESHSQANIAGRTSLLRLVRFLKTLPGLENLTIASMQPETAVRETYRIEGLYQVTAEDYVSGRIFKDAIGYSYYPLDLHNAEGVNPEHLGEGAVATIPYRALIPKGSHNLLVAGRCISSDRLANSALRVQASCMAMGQAAGAAAALCAKKGISPEDLPIDSLRSTLASNGAILP